MSENKTKDFFWQAQGLKSFCKAKSDWFEYERIHLAFVKHDGKPTCKQESAIEGALKIHGADGALYLSEMVLSGMAKKLADKSKKDAEAANSKYAKDIFQSMGGTSASRSKDRKCTFRMFSVAPGTASDYVFKMLTCEGEETETGGIKRKANSQAETIMVPVSSGDLVSFAVSVQMEWGAYRNICMFTNLAPQNVAAELPEDTTESAEPQQTEEQPEKNPEPERIVIIYDAGGYFNNGLPYAVNVENAEAKLQEITKLLLASKDKMIANKGEYDAAVKRINDREEGHSVINFTAKHYDNITSGVVIIVQQL